ncbi:hypothetical protein [Pseudarthrobacter sulfonivorans]|uniref:hypothetical protein n=1 Tax=Pseudarthrobacter sulfonivorans TaxID=121292 RepID=UPI002102690D|nr:hypothetical protein [Pseudarthrobacter sulfonivorans]
MKSLTADFCAAVAVFSPAGAAVAGLIAIEARSSGKPTAKAVALRSPLPRTGRFEVDFTSDYTFHEERPATFAGLELLATANRITDLVIL